MRTQRRLKGSGAVLATVAGLAMFAAACGGGPDSSSSTRDSDGSGSPTPGGEVVYGLENESSGGFCLPEAQLTTSGMQVARTIYDTLTAPNENDEYEPFLAESVEPNDDFTLWTIKLRDGIKFHDDSDLTATVVKNNLDAYRGAYPARQPLVFQFVFEDISAIDVVDDLTVEITTKVPWAALPATLHASGRIGMVAQAQLDDPDHCDTKMIGTGPFKLDEWVINDHLTASRNPHYWQEDAHGNELPYLDKIEYKPIVDETTRVNTLQSGELQVMHTTNGYSIETIKAAADSGELTEVGTDQFAEVEHLMFNVMKPPFDNLVARRAVTAALDRDQFNKVIGLDQFKVASGPFAEGVTGYLADTGFPDHDLAEARELAAQYESETGRPLEFTITGDNNPGTALSMSFVQDQMKAAGIKVRIKPTEVAQQINIAFGDDWEVQMWRNHPGGDPDTQYNWWYGGSPVNFGKFNDPEINALLDKGRRTPNSPERTQAYEDLNRLFAENLYNVWLTWSKWTVGTATDVHGVLGPPLPDGSAPFPGLASGHPVTGLWISRPDP